MWLILPYHVDVPMKRIPWANWALMGVTTILSLAGLGSYWELGEDAWLWKWCLRRDEFAFYQLFTHQFVHANLLHLIVNMFFLFLFGNAINAKLGHGRFLVVYLSLGALSGLAWLASTQGELLLGASGAICGIAGMFLILYPLNEVAVFYLWFFVAAGDMGISYISAIWVLTAFFLTDLAGAFFWAGEPIAYIAHVAGYVFGAGMAWAMLTGRWIEPEEGEETLLQVLGMSPPARERRKRKKKRSLIRKEPSSEPASSPSPPPVQKPWSSWGD
ncbi:MAG: rhomboid family intramembrane serine protease [Gemmatales bacterium]|nr:rhomboid family intramembrane serine protease [Gemmatales bacterium]MDW7995037.1 rhomboid family intramembrane serine protease [Gemmatales bacterium]